MNCSLGKDVNELLMNLLKERKEEIEEKKAFSGGGDDGFRISVLTQKLLDEEYGKNAPSNLPKGGHGNPSLPAVQPCSRMIQVPGPLCHEHHSIAHAVGQSAGL